MTGSDYERRLVRILSDQGYHVMRAPSSGGATTRELPDVFYSKVSEPPIAAELKTTSQNVAYFDKEEAAAVKRFSTAFGAKARLIARYKQDTTYYAHRIENARVTDSDRLAIDREIEATDTIQP